MDNVSLFEDTFSSLEDEQILNVKRPSLISISSDEGNVLDKSCYDDMADSNVDLDQITFRGNNLPCSTPYTKKRSNIYSTDDNHLTKDIKTLSLSICDEPINNTYVLSKSASLHDLSLAAQNMVPLRRDLITYSTETLQSNSAFTTKSKDSGFQRSTSCTSITTVNGSKKYDHVPSKVKQYIQSIKQREALNKMKKQQCIKYNNEIIVVSPSDDSAPVSKKDLLSKVRELEEEIKEKDDVIDQLAKDHNQLKLKYAAVENRIDDLRIKIDCMKKKPTIVSDDKLMEMLETKIGFNDSYLNGSSVTNTCDGEESNSLYSTNNYKKYKKEECPVYNRKFFASALSSNIPSNSQSQNVQKSFSYKQICNNKPGVRKSASNVDNVKNISREVKEESCFDKVERWRKSLQWTDEVVARKLNDHHHHHHQQQQQQQCRTRAVVSCCDSSDSKIDDSTITLIKKLKRKKNYNHKEEDATMTNFDSDSGTYYAIKAFTNGHKIANLPQSPSMAGRKLARSVSLVNYDDATTGRICSDDYDSSSSSSSLASPSRRDSYRMFKQKKKNLLRGRMLEQDDTAKINPTSVGNTMISCKTVFRNQNKRASDLKISCDSSSSQCNSWTENDVVGSRACRSAKKYSKLEENIKTATIDKKPNPIIKCKTVDFYNKKIVVNRENGCPKRNTRNVDNQLNDISTKYLSKSRQCRCLSVIDTLHTDGRENLEKIVKHANKCSLIKNCDNIKYESNDIVIS